jgi:indolepyruvate ferredoxin oxidoreductase
LQCSTLDVTGLAQKGGAVHCHIRIARRRDNLHSAQIGPGQGDLLLGCDLVVSAEADVLATARAVSGRAVINDHRSITGEQALRPDIPFPTAALRRRIDETYGTDRVACIDASDTAMRLFGDATCANTLLLGLAVQKGLIPISSASIEQAIRLNGVSVEQNLAAFRWGRRLADGASVPVGPGTSDPAPGAVPGLSQGLDDTIARRAVILERSRNTIIAGRYRALVDQARAAESAMGKTGLADAVARSYFRLLCYKDEYEVARLLADPAFQARIADAFEGDYRLVFHLAPPWLTRRDPVTQKPIKRRFGPWTLTAFRVLARLKFLRGTPFDPFGYGSERQDERKLIADYEAAMGEILANLSGTNHAAAIEIAVLPTEIRGFGHIKAGQMAAAKARERTLIAAFRAAGRQGAAAE